MRRVHVYVDDYRLSLSYFTTSQLPFLTPITLSHSNHVGLLLMGGQGIAKNEMDAVKYYSMAARQGYEPAIEALRMVDEMDSIS